MLSDQTSLSPTGPTLSRIVAGTMNWGEWGADYTPRQMADLIATCLENNITSFDHADIYGYYSTEESFGEALRLLGSTTRDQIQLVTKCGIRLPTRRRPGNRNKSYDSSPKHILASVERSLQNLRTDYLDLLLIHRPDPLMDPAEVAETFHQLKNAGKVLHFGVSNFTPSQFQLLHNSYPLATNQVECNPLHPAPLFDGTFDQLLAANIKPMAWSPFGGKRYFEGDGTAVLRLRNTIELLAEAYNAPENAVLLAWLLSHPAGLLPVIGTTKTARITEATAAMKIDLDRQDWFRILEAARGVAVD